MIDAETEPTAAASTK